MADNSLDSLHASVPNSLFQACQSHDYTFARGGSERSQDRKITCQAQIDLKRSLGCFQQAFDLANPDLCGNKIQSVSQGLISCAALFLTLS